MSWATVIVAWAQGAALLALVARRERLALAPFASETVRMWLAGGAATLVAWGALQLIPWGVSWFAFLGQALIGIALIGGLYVAFALALRVEEPRRLLAALRRGSR
jgi:hypothetical protein